MLELGAALAAEGYEVSLALPGPGAVAEAWPEAARPPYFYRADRGLLTYGRERVSPRQATWWPQLARTRRAARSLQDVIEVDRPDVIHSHSQKAHVFASLAAAGTGVPVVWHMRDILAGRFARGAMDALAAARAARVIAISAAVASQFRWARGKVTVVYNAVAAPGHLSRDAAARLRSSWGIPAGSQVAGCVGQIAPWKGQHVFVDAAAALAPAFPDLYFVVVGGPLYGADEYYAELRSRVKRAGLAPRFRFLGHRPDAPQCIGAFDLLVHAPVEPEPFGRVVPEAMARGVPVVAARTGGIGEIMEDGCEGFLVEAGRPGAAAAAAAFLLDDPVLRAEMGANGRANYLRRFTVGRLCREVRHVYADVLGGEGPAGVPVTVVTVGRRVSPRRRAGSPTPMGAKPLPRARR
jgi:glycosyltransferase involved in cell wall biosynthesis